MAKLIVLEFMTLDGVMEAPENWQFPYFSEDVTAFNVAQIHALDAQLLGRVTYDAFAESWAPMTNNEHGIADKFNAMPKYVVSSTLQNATWNNSTIIRNAPEEIAKLKQEIDGTIGIIGSATLVQSLMSTDLIDEYQLQIYPVVQGKGIRLFTDDSPSQSLKLIEQKTFQSGAILLTYQPDNSIG